MDIRELESRNKQQARIIDEMRLQHQAAIAEASRIIQECRAALAEELAAWDIDPPLHHVKKAHDRCEEWLRSNAKVKGGRDERN